VRRALQKSGIPELVGSPAVMGIAFERMVVPSIGGTWLVRSAGYAYWFIAAHISDVAVSPNPICADVSFL
jgi:hypothetical protein